MTSACATTCAPARCAPPLQRRWRRHSNSPPRPGRHRWRRSREHSCPKLVPIFIGRGRRRQRPLWLRVRIQMPLWRRLRHQSTKTHPSPKPIPMPLWHSLRHQNPVWYERRIHRRAACRRVFLLPVVEIRGGINPSEALCRRSPPLQMRCQDLRSQSVDLRAGQDLRAQDLRAWHHDMNPSALKGRPILSQSFKSIGNSTPTRHSVQGGLALTHHGAPV